ncbi:hypothetical protein GCM10010174_28610 [Kutzneria viridogrisea]|uniref:IrrE N-terminal-like domain-containing protein n=1 Tax=Kutzneria viridogrisea TaxID=47990 RepID=A0ABR6BJ05_9PSEU|nr:hypothetical protein [Kutzneria viridogrisea]
MKGKQLRALRNELISDLDLPTSATTELVCVRICEVMAQRLQLDIRLRFDDLGHTGMSGLWAQTNDGVHVIIVTTTRSWLHRLLILLHEIAHMLCGHTPMQMQADESNKILFPDVSPEMLRILAGRTSLSPREEREADRVAGFLTRGLLDWARQRQQGNDPFEPSADDAVGRLSLQFGYSPQRSPR